jgi:hypothetical protein
MRVNIEKEIAETNDIQTVKEKRWLQPKDLKELLGWSLSWQSKARMTSSKVQLPFKKVGRFIIYDRYEIDAFIEEHTIVGGE